MPDAVSVFDIDAALRQVRDTPRFSVHGRVTRIIGTVIEATGLNLAVGERCSVEPGGEPILAEVVGFHERGLLLMPFGDVTGIPPGTLVRSIGRKPAVGVSDALAGRVLDGLGRPIDGLGPIVPRDHYPLNCRAPNPLERKRVTEVLSTGVRAIDPLSASQVARTKYPCGRSGRFH